MSRPMRYLEQLCQLEHRGSSTAQAERAALMIEENLREMGHTVSSQRFQAPRDTLYVGPALTLTVTMLAALLSRGNPWLALAIVLVAAVPLMGEMLGSALDYDRVLPRKPSRNLLSVLPAASEERRRVVLSAHYDTQRASLLFHPAFAALIQPYFYLSYGALIAVVVGLLLKGVGIALVLAGWLVGIGGLLCALSALFLLICRATGYHVIGANDNGSGVAILLSLAERFAGKRLDDTTIYFLFTASEEVGTRGMKHFVCTAGLPKADTYFINIDNVGAGRLHYLTGEGMLQYYPSGKRLLDVVSDLSRAHPDEVFPRKNLLLPTDGLIPARSGYETITFLAFEHDGRLPNYHWYTDRIEKIDQNLLNFVDAFVVDCLGSLQGHPVAAEITVSQ